MKLTALVLALTLLPSALFCSSKPKVLNSVRPLFAEVPVRPENPFEALDPDAKVKYEVRKICSASSINQDLHLFLTAGHCVSIGDETIEQMKQVDPHPRFIDGHKATVIVLNGDFDLAVLQVEDLDVPALKVQAHDVTFGEKIMMPGFPYNWTEPTIFQGIVANPNMSINPADKNYMIFNMASASGNSGSAVVNMKGELVSVLQVGWGRGFGAVSGGATYIQLVSVILPYIQ
jgi:S1-C subfamily serine protease